MNTICTVLLLIVTVFLGLCVGVFIFWLLDTINKIDKGEK